MSDEPKCPIHEAEKESLCSWCGQIICHVCIEAAGGKKYCPRCYTKVKGNAASSYESARPKGTKVENKGSLTEEQIAEARERMGFGEKKKTNLPRRRVIFKDCVF
jgi:hypothetical protein